MAFRDTRADTETKAPAVNKVRFYSSSLQLKQAGVSKLKACNTKASKDNKQLPAN